MTAILIVEDNADLAYGLRNNLEIEGYEVDVARDGPSGLTRARSSRPDLVILDLMLPGLDGYRVLKTLRDDGFDMPVLILTAHGQEADKVRGFRLGADDYVTKPFGLLELMARVGALLRRAGRRRAPADIPREVFGAIEIDPATRSVHRHGVAVALTPMEFDLLIALLDRGGERRQPPRAAARGLGALVCGVDSNRRYSHRRIAAEAGNGSGRARAHSHCSEGGLSASPLMSIMAESSRQEIQTRGSNPRVF